MTRNRTDRLSTVLACFVPIQLLALAASAQPTTPPIAAGDADYILRGQGPMESFGYSVIMRDYRDDARDEIFVGAPGAEDQDPNNSDTEYGRLDIFAFQTNEWTIVQSLDQYDASGVTPTKRRFGHTMTVCDLNFDGQLDLIVGAPGEDQANTADNGVVYVFSLESNGMWAYQDAIVGIQQGEQFGWSINSGDLDDDGLDDLIIGSRYWSECDDPGGCGCDPVEDWVGRCYIVLGQDQAGFGWLGASADDADMVINGADSVICHGEDGVGFRDYFGSQVRYLGDINVAGDHSCSGGGDPQRYFAVTAYRASAFDQPEGCTDPFIPTIPLDCRNGRVYVFSYQELACIRSQLPTTEMLCAFHHWTAMYYGPDKGDRFGRRMGFGDFNGDGALDLIAGATQSIDSVDFQLYGYARAVNLSTGSVIGTLDGENLAQAHEGERFGWWVDAAPGFNSDAVDEVVVGAVRWPFTGADTRRGRVIIFDGSSGAVIAEFRGDEENDRFGHTGCADEDIGGTTRPDLIFGTPAALDPVSGQRRGAVYIFER